MRTLVFELKADAIIAGNDLWGAGLIHQLHKHRIKVPEDIAVIGYGDFHYCPVKFEKIRNYVILISNGFINGGWIWRMQNIVFV